MRKTTILDLAQEVKLHKYLIWQYDNGIIDNITIDKGYFHICAMCKINNPTFWDKLWHTTHRLKHLAAFYYNEKAQQINLNVYADDVMDELSTIVEKIGQSHRLTVIIARRPPR